MHRAIKMLLSLYFAAGLTGQALAFDHQPWDRLLKNHVRWINQGVASQVDYAGFQKDSAQLNRYLADLSGVGQTEFDRWSRDERLAFLINAYNAFTIQLVLTRYPGIASIKDLGSVFQSPWKKRFFRLLGKRRHLDEIEHDMIRKPGVYDEPRIHAAVVCASIGCPALRDEAFLATRLDRQLEDSFRRFLSDKSRNRYNSNSGALEVSKIFDWYQEDFSKGYLGFTSLQTVFGKYADLLATRPQDRQRIRRGVAPIEYLNYDWDLNDIR
jgi:hypothetical protein